MPFTRSRPPVLVLSQNGMLLEFTCATLATAGFHHQHVLGAARPARFSLSRRVRSFTPVGGAAGDDAALRALVLRRAEETGAKVLLPVAAPDVGFAARQAGFWPKGLAVVPVPEAGLWETVSEKLGCMRLLERLGFDIPPTLEAVPGLTRAAVEASLSYPILAKPRRFSGGEGIRLLRDGAALEAFLRATPTDHLLQSRVPGEDVALTLLCEAGEVFGVVLRRRWFQHNAEDCFAPIRDVEFFSCDWLEAIGRRLVEATGFSGIADFDLRVDFEGRRAWFLECDPRLMAGQRSCAMFGVNVPGLLCRRALGEHLPLVRNREGRFLSLPSLWPWLKRGGWFHDRKGVLRTGLRAVAADPLPVLARRLGLAK